MPSYASLLHPIVCPYCGALSAHEIQFLEGYFSETSQIDIRLGENFAILLGESVPAENSKGDFNQLKKALYDGFRTHGHSLCIRCNGAVALLVALKDYCAVRLEVFPARVQCILADFPSCMFMNSNNDEDLIFLSRLLGQFGATRICAAIEKLAKKYYGDNLWKERNSRTREFLKKYPVLKDFMSLVDDEPPSDDDASGAAKTRRYENELSSLLEDEEFFQALDHNRRRFRQEQTARHAELKKFLENAATF